ncbi:DNA helicase MCM9 [Stegastes partitus]|uniref:DNA helicase MCM9 n=2 Tax=Stegastes partitus TaxID=144197 RepID=A0A9Y4NCY9_9TELE|nr:PREDICTED: DNA helicase MCM9 [Stegastes partitus]
MLIGPEQEALIGRVFESYLTEHHHGDLLQLSAGSDEDAHRPVVVNAMTLFETNMELGDYFNAYPEDVLAIFDKVLHKRATELSDDSSPKRKDQRMRRTLHARITGQNPAEVQMFRGSNGSVLEFERDYMCTKCRHVFTVQADFDQFYTFVPPLSCSNPTGCNSFKFSCLSEGCEPAACRDYQEIKIQEQVQRLTVGSIPRSVVVVLEDDLVDSCKSGDDVTVYGVVCQRWKSLYEGSRCEVELVLKANNIEVNNQQTAAALLVKDVQKEFEEFWQSFRTDPIAGRNHILLSLCPQVFGMYVVKLAVALVLAGGVQRVDSSGTKIRGECHMLLVGDPGTGKSQFLKYAAKITPRSVLTAGIGSTSAGLTVAAVKDGGEWHLEAGALVLSDGGLCCIDEFNSIKEHDRISIHEAMEQQSISVAKAGMVCKLNTRTTILAATNPKGRYDPSEPLSVNVALASPLLSRFDLVLVLLDTRNPEWDCIISSFILEDRGLPADSSALWSMEKMKVYFSVIKQLQPQVSDEANCILTRYYQLQRQSDGRNAARTTIRMLESLSRLAEAHCRLMFRETVSIEDAVVAVSVMECSMQGGALLGNVNTLLTSFPADPELQYQTQCQVLLEGLNLPLLLQKEMDRLDRLKTSSSDGSQFDPLTGNQQRPVNIITPERQNMSLITADHIITSTQENPQTDTSVENQQNLLTNKASGSVKTVASVTENTKSQRQNDESPPESLPSVLQKVSEDVTFRQQLSHRHHAQGAGPVHGAESVHGAGPAQGAGSAQGEGRTAASKLCSPKVLDQNKLSTGPESQCEQEDGSDPMKSFRAVLKNQTAAEGPADLQAKLSGFRFRPTKMRPSVTLRPEIQTNSQNPVSPYDSATQHQQNQVQRVVEVRPSREQSEARTGSTSTQLDPFVAQRRNNTAAVSPQRSRTNTNKETKTFTALKPNSDGPLRSSLGSRTVASSTRAKLSRFSFTCAGESTTGTEEEEEERGDAGRLRSKAKRALSSPNSSPSGKRTRTQQVLPPSTAGQNNQEPQTDVESRTKQPELRQTEQHRTRQSDGQAPCMQSQRAFRLDPPAGSEGSAALFTGLTLFGSAELTNDVLDTDWDQEVLKKS